MEAIIINNILKSDFKTQAEVQGFEVFDTKTVLALRKLEKNIIQKSLTEELTEEDEMQLEICKSEVNSLKAANVVSDETLRKELVFFRKKDSDIEKAAGHKYFKREPKAGGGYKYYYTEAEYKQAKGGVGEAKNNNHSEIAKKFKEISTNPNAEHKINGIIVNRESANDVHSVLSSFETEKEKNDFIGNKSIGQIIVDSKKILNEN